MFVNLEKGQIVEWCDDDSNNNKFFGYVVGKTESGWIVELGTDVDECAYPCVLVKSDRITVSCPYPRPSQIDGNPTRLANLDDIFQAYLNAKNNCKLSPALERVRKIDTSIYQATIDVLSDNVSQSRLSKFQQQLSNRIEVDRKNNQKFLSTIAIASIFMLSLQFFFRSALIQYPIFAISGAWFIFSAIPILLILASAITAVLFERKLYEQDVFLYLVDKALISSQKTSNL